MADEVKKVDQAASTGEEVKKDGVDASATKEETELDLAEELVKALERAAKAETERDNYKEGMLKAKGKSKGDEAAADETKDSAAPTLQPLLRRIKELETAAANKSQISTAGQGAGSETTMQVGDNMLSADQIKALQAKGWDDKKIARFKQNLINSRS